MQRILAPGPVRLDSRWLTDAEPPYVEPGDDASELIVARYLDDMRHLTEIPPSSVMTYCRRRSGTRPSFRPGTVLTYLVLLRPQEDRRRRLGKVRHNHLRWVAMSSSLPKSVKFCPRPLWRMDKYSGDVFCMYPPCDTWRCQRACAENKANDVIEHACWTFLTLDQVWHAVLPYNDQLHDWLRQRRQRTGGGALWVHRDDDNTVHVYASADLSTRVRPNLGQWVTPLDALNDLIDTTLVLPGVHGRQWLGTWKPASKARKKARSFTLGVGPHELMEVALNNARQTLEQSYGVGALNQLSPDDIEAIWLPLVEEEIDKQWTIRKAGAQPPTAT